MQHTVGRGIQGRDNRQTRAAYQNLLRPVPPVSRLQTDLLVWVALFQTPKADRRNSLMGSGQSIDLSPARPNWQTARPYAVCIFAARAVCSVTCRQRDCD